MDPIVNDLLELVAEDCVKRMKNARGELAVASKLLSLIEKMGVAVPPVPSIIADETDSEKPDA